MATRSFALSVISWCKKGMKKKNNPEISIDVPHYICHTFPKMLTRRIFLTTKNFFSW